MDKGLLQLTKVIRSSCRLQLQIRMRAKKRSRKVRSLAGSRP